MSAPAYTLTVEELEALVERAVRKAAADPKSPASVAPSDVMTRDQVAKLLGVNAHRILRLVEDEGLPHHPFGKRGYRFLRGEVMSWMAGRKDRV